MLTDKERLVLIEHMAKIKDDGQRKKVEMDFHEWCWLIDLAEETLNNYSNDIPSFNIPEPFQSVIEKQQKEIEKLKVDNMNKWELTYGTRIAALEEENKKLKYTLENLKGS